MKRNSIFLSIIFLFGFLASYASGVPIRYDLVGGIDTNSNPFSGYMDIEEEVQVPLPDNLVYSIVGFEFTASGMSFTGEYGLLQIMNGPTEGIVCPNSGDASLAGDNGVNWNNDMNGVWFDGDYTNFVPTESYMTLPQEILIYGFGVYDSWSTDVFWGPLEGTILALNRSAQPVPEPSTILLVGIGIGGLAGFRRMFRKR